MFSINHLTSGYNDKIVLKEVDFEIKPSEIVAVLGLNGSGKSTLLKSIYNLCQVYSGEIRFNDKNITRMPTHQMVYEHISYVQQGGQVFKNLTVRENLEMGAFTIKNKKNIKNKINNIFTKFPFLEKKQNDYAFSLSKGQQQTLSIAGALMQNPSLLLLDEPSLGLSPKILREVFEIIRKINQEGISIILVEQNINQALKLANRTYILRDGVVVLSGYSGILDNKMLRRYMFG